MARNLLTPDALTMMDVIARTGSFAAAARELGKVPSALTYNVRQLEDALDVLLFDRSSRQARPTDAGAELLREGGRLLMEVDAVANRVKRVATGWESQLTVAVDTVISCATVMELAQAFFEVAPSTRLRLRDETLSGTLEALSSGQADLALGVPQEAGSAPGRSVPRACRRGARAGAGARRRARAPGDSDRRPALHGRARARGRSRCAARSAALGVRRPGRRALPRQLLQAARRSRHGDPRDQKRNSWL